MSVRGRGSSRRARLANINLNTQGRAVRGGVLEVSTLEETRGPKERRLRCGASSEDTSR